MRIEDKRLADFIHRYVKGVIDKHSEYMTIRILNFLEKEVIEYIKNETKKSLKSSMISDIERNIRRLEKELYLLNDKEDYSELRRKEPRALYIKRTISNYQANISYIKRYGEFDYGEFCENSYDHLNESSKEDLYDNY